jgi:hypothetical protein
MMMLPKLTTVAMMIALVTSPASAQVASSGLTRPTTSEPSRAEIERQKADEKAYQSAISRIPGPVQKSDDPWGDVRTAPPQSGEQKKPQ